MIELHHVAKHHRRGPRVVQALRGVSLAIAADEFVCIMGPSGSAKSTSMNILGVLDVPTAGTVHFRGTDLQALTDAERSRLGWQNPWCVGEWPEGKHESSDACVRSVA